MKKLNFLTRLKDEELLILVEPSEEISKSYLIKRESSSVAFSNILWTIAFAIFPMNKSINLFLF